jgi:hypothetical protein
MDGGPFEFDNSAQSVLRRKDLKQENSPGDGGSLIIE